MPSIHRRRVLGGLAATVAAPFLLRPARAADFRLKLSLNTPVDHPVSVRSREAAAKILADTGGACQIDVFPSSQLGGDTDALSQLRSGALEIQAVSGGVVANLIPGANLYNVAFAFPNYDAVWAALDGGVGQYVGKLVEAAGLHSHARVWDNGFRQCTSSLGPIERPADLRNFKLRVAPAPLLVSVFKSLGASIATINVAETYSALQTHVVDGQENGLALIDSLKLYEVQKYCSTTNHMWDGFLLLFNGRAWRRLPADVQAIVTKHFDTAILQQRDDLRKLDTTLQATLKTKGLVFNAPDPNAFKAALTTAGFYTEWKGKLGAEAWTQLERYAGPLA